MSDKMQKFMVESIKDRALMNQKIDDLLKDNKEAHDKILEQVKKTNGSVAEIQKWRYLINGGLIVMNILFVPVLIWFLINFIFKS